MEARQKGAEAVSTHSRPKAAGWIRKQQALALKRFNSQPPEGGWDDGEVVIVGQQFRFNSQPPEGGWRIQYFSIPVAHLGESHFQSINISSQVFVM